MDSPEEAQPTFYKQPVHAGIPSLHKADSDTDLRYRDTDIELRYRDTELRYGIQKLSYRVQIQRHIIQIYLNHKEIEFGYRIKIQRDLVQMQNPDTEKQGSCEEIRYAKVSTTI